MFNSVKKKGFSFFFFFFFTSASIFFSPPSSVHHAHSSPTDGCVYRGLPSVRGSLIFKKEVRMRNGKKRGIKHTLTISWKRSKTNCAVACASPLVHMHACPCIRLLSGVAKLIYVRAEPRNWSAGIQIPPPPLPPQPNSRHNKSDPDLWHRHLWLLMHTWGMNYESAALTHTAAAPAPVPGWAGRMVKH